MTLEPFRDLNELPLSEYTDRTLGEAYQFLLNAQVGQKIRFVGLRNLAETLVDDLQKPQRGRATLKLHTVFAEGFGIHEIHVVNREECESYYDAHAPLQPKSENLIWRFRRILDRLLSR